MLPILEDYNPERKAGVEQEFSVLNTQGEYEIILVNMDPNSPEFLKDKNAAEDILQDRAA